MSAKADNLSQKPRMFFVDNLRILLTILVISHHISITYGAPGSYDRKGGGKFLKDRLMRLGIPLVFYMVVIDPLLRASGYSGRYRSFCARRRRGMQVQFRFTPVWSARPAARR